MVKRAGLSRWKIVGAGVVSIAAASTFGAFCWPGIVQSVWINMGPAAIYSDAFLNVGDVDTLHAIARTRDPVFRIRFDSKDNARRFTYRSYDTTIATVDADGVVRAVRPGAVDLTASYDSIASARQTVNVSPAARELRATPVALNARVGDTVAVTITAHDAEGQSVAGVLFDIHTLGGNVATVLRIRQRELRTPAVVHFRAEKAGEHRVFASTPHVRPRSRLRTKNVSIGVVRPE